MPNTVHASGFLSDLSVRNIPLVSMYPGKIFWVDSNGPAGYGTYKQPLASIASALTKCKASRGDVIICKPGHVETVAAAVALSVIGVAIVFLGQGSNKAYINLTATGSYLNVTAASVSLINPTFKTAIDAVAKGVLVAAADFTMKDVEYYDAAAKASTIQVLTTSAAARFHIDGYKYFPSTTGTQKTDGIKTVGALDGITLKNIDIRGDFSGYNVNLTNAACTNVQLENQYLQNTNVGPIAPLGLHANTTGFAKNVKCRVASGTTYVSSVAKVQWSDDCEGFSTDGYGGEPIGTAVGSGVEGKVDTILTQFTNLQTQSTMRKRISSVDLVAANLTGTATRFTITGGPIRVLTLGAWTSTAIPAGANTLQFGYTPAGGGGANTLSGATDTASAAADQLFMLDGVKATGPVKTADVGVLAGGQLLTSAKPGNGVILAPGVIQTIFSAGPPASGAMTIFMEWEPLTATAAVA